VADILVVSINTTTNRVDLGRLSFLSSHISSTVFNTPFHLSLASDIFLKGASIFDVSKRTASALDEDLAAIKRELLALQRGVSDSTALPETVSQVNWMTSMKQIIWSI